MKPSRIRLHPEIEPLRCPGGLFDVEPSDLDLNVGRTCRYRQPTCPAQQGLHRIVCVQKLFDGSLGYRTVAIGDDSPAAQFGRAARPEDVIILD